MPFNIIWQVKKHLIWKYHMSHTTFPQMTPFKNPHVQTIQVTVQLHNGIIQYFSSHPVIQLGIGLRTFAHLFLKLSWGLIIKECPNEIVLKLTIVLKISKSSWNTAHLLVFKVFFSSETCKNLKVKDRSKSTYC